MYVGIVSKYCNDDVYERNKKYITINKQPTKTDRPPQIKHKITYFFNSVL